MTNHVLAGVMGLCVGDALGVPVEFTHRETLKENPVVGMRAYGTYNQPAGTWSDDTSMTLCLADSLIRGDWTIGISWRDSSHGSMKGGRIRHTERPSMRGGTQLKKALYKFSRGGATPLECGGTDERDNGNGSLMRILPILFHLRSVYGPGFYDIDEALTSSTTFQPSPMPTSAARSHAASMYLSLQLSWKGRISKHTSKRDQKGHAILHRASPIFP